MASAIVDAVNPVAPSLVSLFDSACALDGDSPAFLCGDFPPREVGLTELRENSLAITSELYRRHGLGDDTPGRIGSTSPSANPPPPSTFASDNGHFSLPPAVLLVSGMPSVGEAAAVLACVRLRVPFVPIDLVGPNRIGMKRLRRVTGEIGCSVAVVVVETDENNGKYDCESEVRERYGTDDDDAGFFSSPAFSTTAGPLLDQHPAVNLLERAGVHRHVMISSYDGRVLNGLGLSDLELPPLTAEETDLSILDPLFVLYTSGSTALGDAGETRVGKAVVQTHGGLINRIRWQWDIFPFAQQMKRDLGLVETTELLERDGIATKNDIVVRRTPLSFVDSMCEIFATLLAGVPLWLPSPDLLSSQGLVGTVAEAARVRATRITCLPSQMEQILSSRKSGVGNQDEWPWSTLNLAIVSGEPCPPSLPPLWERVVNEVSLGKKLLINLYGQTETSADVLCMVVSTGMAPFGRNGASSRDNNPTLSGPSTERSQSEVTRFPRATPFLFSGNVGKSAKGGVWWKGSSLTDDNLSRCLPWTVPCGIPISNHALSIGPPHQKGSGTIGRLYVSGPGLARGYLNLPNTNVASFVMCDGVRWFDTSDLAYLDRDSNFYYILGRAAEDDSKDEDTDCEDFSKACTIIGKINGVMVHTAEVETVLTAALTDVLRSTMLGKKPTPVDSNAPRVVALLYDAHEFSFEGARSRIRRLAAFVDVSTFHSSAQRNLLNEKTSLPRIVSASDVLSGNLSNILMDARSLLLGRSNSSHSSELVCHPSLIPHAIHLVTRLPLNGAAGKVDRSELARMVAKIRFPKMTETTTRAKGKARQMSPQENISRAVLNVYYKVLGDNLLAVNDQSTMLLAFSELGGDSMQAIEAAHELNKELIQKGFGDTFIDATKSDIMQLSVNELSAILAGGSRRPTAEDTSSWIATANTNMQLLMDSGCPILESSTDSEQEIKVAWKVPMLMCVDACPLFIRHPIWGGIILVGSQGGDIVCCRAHSGEVLHRQCVQGKIEGGMNTIEVQDFGDKSAPRHLVYLCTYTNEDTKRDGRTHLGCLYAFEFSRKRSIDELNQNMLSLLWKRQVPGQLKGAPSPFTSLEGTSPVHGVLTGGYDGSLTYFDALSGDELECFSDLGGAIHASPTIVCSAHDVKAFVTSATWTGKVSCVQVHRSSMTKLWSVDIWSPIYCSPTVCNVDRNRTALSFGGIDGVVRCIDVRDGSEIFRVKTKSLKPIFSRCIRIGSAATESIVFGSHDGSITCFSAKNGSIRWIYKMSGSVLGAPCVVGERIVVASTAGNVVALTMAGEVEKIISKPLDGEIFSTPSAIDGSLYVGARDDHLYKLWI